MQLVEDKRNNKKTIFLGLTKIQKPIADLFSRVSDAFGVIDRSSIIY